MKWSVKIGRLAGIDVRMHLTFLLLLLWVAFVERAQQHTGAAILVSVLFTIAVFFTVVLHELGHALVARRYGIRTREIILLPIGGVSRLERMPEDPRRELNVAIAGPAVSLGIAVVLFLVLRGGALIGVPWGEAPGATRFLWRLMWVNVSLAAFNLVPAFPMDGGRVLRAALATRMPYARATLWAARLGQGLALALGLIGLFASPLLIFIALFVWMGAAQEGYEAQIRDGLEGIPARSAMETDFKSLAPADPLSHAAELVLAGAQQDFPVLEDGALVGVLTRQGLLRALAENGASGPVGGAMDRAFETADPSEMLSDVLPRVQGAEVRTVPVVRDGRVVGLLTPENIADYLAIQAATRAPHPGRHDGLPAGGKA
jgi:Zn-dependent protease